MSTSRSLISSRLSQVRCPATLPLPGSCPTRRKSGQRRALQRQKSRLIGRVANEYTTPSSCSCIDVFDTTALREFFGPSYARDLTLDRLDAYVAARLNDGVAPASIRNDLAVMRRAFRLAQRAGKALCPPFPSLQVHTTRSGFFEREDSEAVRSHRQNRFKE